MAPLLAPALEGLLQIPENGNASVWGFRFRGWGSVKRPCAALVLPRASEAAKRTRGLRAGVQSRGHVFFFLLCCPRHGMVSRSFLKTAATEWVFVNFDLFMD